VIGGIPAGALKDNSGRGEDLAQAVLVAFRAALERFIGKRLVALKLYAAAFAAIYINGHSCISLLTKLYYSPLKRGWQDSFFTFLYIFDAIGVPKCQNARMALPHRSDGLKSRKSLRSVVQAINPAGKAFIASAGRLPGFPIILKLQCWGLAFLAKRYIIRTDVLIR